MLEHPIFRDLEGIVKLRGICWDIAETGDHGYKVWPVLVFEKAEHGDFGQFIESKRGKGLSFVERLELCVGLGTALMEMHTCCSLPLNSIAYSMDH